ncbi:hypothetical protein G3N92_34495, partial [Burkholderia sp. Ac-20379]|nr:hypothetical protein [Burkholderia sp. Ac-20379]
AQAQAVRLEQAGLGESGRALRALAHGLHGAEPAALPTQLGWLTLLLCGIAES